MKKGKIFLLTILLIFVSSCIQETTIQKSPTSEELYVDTFAGGGDSDEYGIPATEADIGNNYDAKKDSEGNVHLIGHSNLLTVDTDGIIDENYVIAASAWHHIDVDNEDNIYIAYLNQRQLGFIPKISGNYFGQDMDAGTVYIIATGFAHPNSVFAKDVNNVYVADGMDPEGNPDDILYKINPTTGEKIIIAGTGEIGGDYGDGSDPLATAIAGPRYVYVDDQNNIFWSDDHSIIRMIPSEDGNYFDKDMTAGLIYSVVGARPYDSILSPDGTYIHDFHFNYLGPIEMDQDGNLFMLEMYRAALLFMPVEDGTYYNVPMEAYKIYTIAGTREGGYSGDGGPALDAQFDPREGGMDVVSPGEIYIADHYNERVRLLTSGNPYGGGSPLCGNEVVDEGEQCDIDTPLGVACLNYCHTEYNQKCVGCVPPGQPNECQYDCQPYCGNGVVEEGEECDDGNTDNEDGCSSECLLENADTPDGDNDGPGSGSNPGGDSSARCGDNRVNRVSEECDGTELNGESCSNQGFDGGEIACNDDCTLNTTNCYTEGSQNQQAGQQEEENENFITKFPTNLQAVNWAILILALVGIILVAYFYNKHKTYK